MPKSVDVKKMAQDLHAAKLINLDAPAKSFLDVAGSHFASQGQLDPQSKVADYAIAWDHYVVVCGLQQFGEQVQKIAANAGNIKE